MRVLVVRLGSMGDVLHALPAAAALRAAHPDAYIGWAIERRWTPFLVAEGTPLSGARSPQRPLVDHVHIVDTLGWRKAPLSTATWAQGLDAFREIHAQRYDVAIDFQGSVKSGTVTQFSGAATRIGFAAPREKPATLFYTSVVEPTGRHVIEQNLSLLSSVVPLRSSAPTAVNTFPHDPAAESAIEASARNTPRFAILNPGAGWPAKQWPAARYGEVARALHDDGIFCLVNHGPSEEQLASQVEAAAGGNARAIRCTLSELVSLTRRASLFIGGDTGPMHLAALLGVPVVALFGPTDPARNGPYSANSIVLRHPSSRNLTSHSAAPDPGLLQITAEDALTAVRALLARSPKPEAGSPIS